jgi:hypothetical protein
MRLECVVFVPALRKKRRIPSECIKIRRKSKSSVVAMYLFEKGKGLDTRVEFAGNLRSSWEVSQFIEYQW